MVEMYRDRTTILGVINDPQAIKKIGGFRVLNRLGVYKNDKVAKRKHPLDVRYKGRYNISYLANIFAVLDRIDRKSGEIGGEVRIGFSNSKHGTERVKGLNLIELRLYPSGLRIVLAPRIEPESEKKQKTSRGVGDNCPKCGLPLFGGSDCVCGWSEESA